MPSITDLEQAGHRAAVQPVPVAPPLALVQQNARKRRTTRRVVGGCVGALALIGAGVPIALSVDNDPPAQTVAAGAGSEQVAPPAELDESDGSDPAADDETDEISPAAVQDGSDDGEEQAQIELRYGPDFALSISVLRGPEAEAAAVAADAGADETRDLDGTTVWITRNNDIVSVAALVGSDEFIDVQGPAEQLERLLDVLETGGFELPEFPNFPPADMESFFDEFRDQFDDFDRFDGFGESPFVFGDGEEFGFFFDFDGELPDFGRFGHDPENGGFPNFEPFPEDGEFPDLGELFEEFPGDFPDFENFFDGETLPSFEHFFDEHDLGSNFGDLGEEFDGCISIDIQGDTEFQFEFPQGCRPSG